KCLPTQFVLAWREPPASEQFRLRLHRVVLAMSPIIFSGELNRCFQCTEISRKRRVLTWESCLGEIRRWSLRQLCVTRWIDLKKFLRGFARSGGFRNRFSIFIFGVAR